MLHSVYKEQQNFHVKHTEPPMDDSMQENGIERKMFTCE